MAEKQVLTNGGLFGVWDDALDVALELVPGRKAVVGALKVALAIRAGVKVLRAAQLSAGAARRAVVIDSIKTGILYVLIDHEGDIERWVIDSIQVNLGTTVAVVSLRMHVDP